MSIITTPPYNFTPQAFVSAPKGWDTVWRAALAASGTTPCWLYWLGDSIHQGPVSTDWMNKSVWSVVNAGILARGYNRYADFWPSALSADFATLNGSTFTGTPPWTVNNTTSRSSLSWFNGKPTYYTATNAAMPCMTFVTPYACTAFDILHSPNATGSWQYAIDGGGAVTVNTTATGAYTRIAVSGQTNATHTITIGNVVNGTTCIIDGIVTYKPGVTGGVGFANCAVAGNQMKAYANTTNTPTPRSFILMGREKTATPAGNFGFPTQPHLAIMGLGINDCNNNVGLDEYAYALKAGCEAFRAGRANCSIVMVGVSSPDGIHSDVTTPFGNVPAAYPWYLDVMQTVAQSEWCAFVDIHAAWADKGVALGYQQAAEVHPTDAGHADMAARILAVI